MEQLKQQLQAAGILYKENEPLSAHCTFRIGGPADLFVMPRDEDQLCQTVQFCKQAEIRYYLLGNGSNMKPQLYTKLSRLISYLCIRCRYLRHCLTPRLPYALIWVSSFIGETNHDELVQALPFLKAVKRV